MIALKTWDSLYRHHFDWVLSRLNPDCLKSFKDTEKDWLEAMLAFDKFQHDLFKDYSVNYKSGDKYKRSSIKGIELTNEQLYDLYQKHLSKYSNYTVRSFLFHWWNKLRYYIDGAQPELDAPYLYFKPATKEEIEQARKNFSHVKEKHWYDNKFNEHNHTFKDDAKVIEYRGYRFIIDNEWDEAWTLDKNGKVHHFQLVWDWWFPIDEYLDLYNV